MHRKTIAIVALSAALAGCRSETAEQTIQKSWTTESITKLSLRSVRSDISVVGRPGNQIRLVADVRVTGPDAKRLLKDGPLDFTIKDGVLSISETSLRGSRMAIPFIMQRGGAEIDYELEVPPSLALAITNVSGSIDVKGMQAASDLQSVNGSIDVESTGAPIAARTVNGPIDATFTHHFEGAKLRTVNGPVEVKVPAESSFIANVSQVNGGFESNIPVVLTRNGSRSTAAVGDGKTQLDVTTVNGDITLTRSGGGNVPKIPAPPRVEGGGAIPAPPQTPPIPSIDL